MERLPQAKVFIENWIVPLHTYWTYIIKSRKNSLVHLALKKKSKINSLLP